MSRWTAIVLAALLILPLAACRSAEKTDDGAAHEAAGAADASSAEQDWAHVTAWAGTISVTLDKDIDRTSTTGTKTVTTGHVTTSVTGHVRFGDLYDDGQALSWVGENVDPGLTISVDHRLTTTTFDPQGQVVGVETSTAKGSGETGIVTEDADAFGIDTGARIYAFTLEPDMFEVDCTHRVTAGGDKALVDDAGKCPLDDGYGVGATVEDIPLPDHGMQLKGTRTLDDGTVVSWDLAPVK